MTGEQIREHFQWLVDDDTLDEDRELVLLNIAYDELLAERVWNFLRKTDESATVVSGTSGYDLPDDFLFLIKLTLRLGTGSDATYKVMTPVLFEDRLQYVSDDTKFYIDQANNQIVFTRVPDDANNGYTMVLDYQYQPDQIENDTSPVFNRAFHAVLAYQMAKNYFYNDQGEKSRAWNEEMQTEYLLLKEKMVTWDSVHDTTVAPSSKVLSWIPDLE